MFLFSYLFYNSCYPTLRGATFFSGNSGPCRVQMAQVARPSPAACHPESLESELTGHCLVIVCHRVRLTSYTRCRLSYFEDPHRRLACIVLLHKRHFLDSEIILTLTSPPVA